jgi:hypothetical protein
MGKTISDKVKDLKADEAALIVREVSTASEQNAATGAAMLLGAAGALDATARLTASQSVRAVQRFRDTKGHEALGFSNFKEFLNKSPHSPMSYDQFNDREKLLEREGDIVFNLLSTMRVPAHARKHLQSGAVQIEGDNVIIAGERISSDDKPRILEVIKTLADKTVEQAAKIEKGKADNLKWKKEAKQAKGSARRADTPTHDQTLMDVVLSMSSYAAEVAKLSDAESAAIRDEAMDLISEQWQKIRSAHRFSDAAPFTAPLSGHQESILTGDDLGDIEDSM